MVHTVQTGFLVRCMVGVALLLLPCMLWSQNDTPCGAIPLTVTTGTCSFLPGTTLGASFQDDAANGGNPACGFPGSADVWYSFVVPPSGSVVVTLEGGTILDAALAVYSGPCGAPVPLGCDDNSGLNGMPVFDRSDLTPGDQLYVRIWDNTMTGGTFGVCATESHSDCSTATVLCSNLAVTSNAYGGGSDEDGDWSGTNCIPDEYQSQWFKFQVLNGGTLAFTITPDAVSPGFYPDYDWTLWRVNTTPFCESFLPSLPAIACNASSSMGPQGQTGVGPTGANPSEPAGPGNPFSADFPVSPGDVFYLWINNFTNSSSGFSFEFDPSIVLNCDFNDVDPVVSIVSTPTCPGECAGSATVTVTDMVAPLTYAWSSNAGGQNTAAIHQLCVGTYTVIVTDGAGEQVFDTVTVSAYPGIQFTVDHVDNSSCHDPNGLAIVHASSASGSLSYSWNTSAQNNDTLSHLSAGTYEVTVSDGNNCSVDTSITLSDAIVYPVIASISTTDSLACGALCTNLSAITTDATEFHWDFGDGQTGSAESPQHCYTFAGDFTVSLIASTASGCSDTLTRSALIKVNPFPHAEFIFNKNDDLHVKFIDKSSDATSWLWEMGDTSQTEFTEQNPEFDYHDFNTYCIDLTVWDENECTDQVQHCITFFPELSIYAPSAFTPNNDGLNDIFRIQGYPLKVIEFWIYNRWGQQVFHTYDPESGWDGKYQLSDVLSPPDIYIYKTEVVGEQGEHQELSGYFQLLR